MGRKPKNEFTFEIVEEREMTPEEIENIAQILARWILDYERKKKEKEVEPKR